MSDDEAVDPEKLFQLNEKKEFKVLDIDTENRKIALSLKEAKAKKAKSYKKAETSKQKTEEAPESEAKPKATKSKD